VEFVEVDGSRGEGGGQILRTAVAFSAITHRPVRVTKIRAGRGVPGLKRQHLSALLVLAKVFGGRLDGASEGSSAITFVPGDARLDVLTVDMGTAASITLVLQAIVPAVALSGRGLRLELTGGTDVPWSPTFDYFENVVREAYANIGIVFDARATRRGYYPRGGGRVVTSIEPCSSVRPLDLTARDKVPGAALISRCGRLPRHVAERQLSAASESLEKHGVRVLAVDISEEQSDSPGSSILVYSLGPRTFLGADGIGARGKPAEEVGREAAAKMVSEAESGACLDSNLADMVLPFLSLAALQSRVRVREVTSHLKSGMEIASMFTACSWSVDSQAGNSIVSVNPSPQKLTGHNV
jgi:RNA 3'-phosphate cyclase